MLPWTRVLSTVHHPLFFAQAFLQPGGKMSVRLEEWDCPQCTFHNGSATECEMCGFAGNRGVHMEVKQRERDQLLNDLLRMLAPPEDHLDRVLDKGCPAHIQS